MIFGNPFEFAFFIDIVDEWSSLPFHNGYFAISIDSNLYPNDVRCSTLNIVLSEILSEKSPLITLPENETLFKDNPKIAFEKIQDITFPENSDIGNDYTYRVQLTEFEDAGYILFMVRFIDQVKLIIGEYCNETFKHKYLDEVIVDQKTINEMIIKIAKTFKYMIKNK